MAGQGGLGSMGLSFLVNPMLNPQTAATIAITVAAGSEILALLPIRSNSWIQLAFGVLKTVFPRRR